MSILSKIFGNNVQAANMLSVSSETEKTLENRGGNIPPIDLFIDQEAPIVETPATPERQNTITVFLNRGYHSIGVNDGYEYHSQETLEIGTKKIKAEFQLIVDQFIQEKFANRLQIKNLIVDVTKISDDTRQKLENTVEELNSSLTILQKQKELSAENEGWVMNAVHSYRQGFVQGVNDYITGENLLNSIKNI